MKNNKSVIILLVLIVFAAVAVSGCTSRLILLISIIHPLRLHLLTMELHGSILML